MLVGGVLHPEETTDPARQYEIVASSADRLELAHWIITASMLLMVGAVLGPVGAIPTTVAASPTANAWELLGESDEQWEHPARLSASPAT